MCGIVGYIGHRKAIPILVNGLEHLEYRGYDSAGIACLTKNGSPNGRLTVIKEKGKLSALKNRLKEVSFDSNIGMGHTRWATHGEPSQANAHPHLDNNKQIALIHNGIIENYAVLKAEMKQEGIKFHSETDTEIAVNLISGYYKKGNLIEAFQKAVKKLHGFFAFVVMAKEEPDKILVFKRSNPIVIGLGNEENFVASDVSALLSYTNRVLYLEDNEYAVVTRKEVSIFTIDGKPVKRTPTIIRWNISQAKKGGFQHFMLKEIYEQPMVIEETLGKRLDLRENIYFDTVSNVAEKRLKKIDKVFLVSCGTAYHAGLVGSYMLEEYAKISTRVQVSSEFRYSDPIVSEKDLVVLITQSGETADTIAALREAKSKGAMTLAIVNVVGSTIAREADAVIYTHAGPEIGVASTKAYTAQLATLALFAFYLGRLRKVLSRDKLSALVQEFKKIPSASTKVLKQVKAIEKCAKKHYQRKNFLYIGRSYNYPTALEGALKLKEISYAHAHGYAAGEMKHGPIALIDQEQPVICIAPESKTYEKMISNIEEIRARRGIVISIGTEGAKDLEKLSSDFFAIPKCSEIFSSILTAIILQVFAYKVSALNGRDVDQPRNLAKSVTVE